MRVVVTGASGFVGSAVLRALREAGHEVVALVREGCESPPKDVEVHVFDLADPSGMAAHFRGADAVIHAAGTSCVRASREALGWIEVAGTENVLRAARHAGVRRLVAFSSTDVTLSAEPRKEMTENRAVAAPVGDFARSLREKEEAVIAAGTPRFQPVVLRAGWLFGEGDRTRLPALVREALREGGLRVVGRPMSFMPTTYVRNLADAAVKAVAAERAAHGIYHVLDREIASQEPFLARLSLALGLAEPHRGGPLWLERLRARLRQLRHSDTALDEAEVLRRGLPSTFERRRTRQELGYEAPFSQEEGMVALAAWLEELGGAAKVLELERKPPSEEEIARLRGD